jgi:2-oxoisovalerate dehydrogenase E1 component subunit alpha
MNGSTLTNGADTRAAGTATSRDSGHEGLSRDELLDAYRLMLLSRKIDDKEIQLKNQSQAFFQISGAGHEAILIAAGKALRPGHDWFLTYYRDRALALTLGVTPLEMFLGSVGAKDDPSSGGRQMPAHWGARDRNIITGSSPIATQVLHAAGIALAKKIKREDAIVGTWFGEGGTSEGDWHGAMNFAGIHKLPLVFVCENNQYAISVHESKQVAGSVYGRGAGYGFEGVQGDGNDVLESYRLTKNAVDKARAGEGPTLIELRTYRYYSHTSDDDDRTYRPKEEVDEWKKKDPIPRFEQYLQSVEVIDEAAMKEMHEKTKEEVAQGAKAAEAADFPDPSTATKNVYADLEVE